MASNDSESTETHIDSQDPIQRIQQYRESIEQLLVSAVRVRCDELNPSDVESLRTLLPVLLRQASQLGILDWILAFFQPGPFSRLMPSVATSPQSNLKPFPVTCIEQSKSLLGLYYCKETLAIMKLKPIEGAIYTAMDRSERAVMYGSSKYNGVTATLLKSPEFAGPLQQVYRAIRPFLTTMWDDLISTNEDAIFQMLYNELEDDAGLLNAHAQHFFREHGNLDELAIDKLLMSAIKARWMSRRYGEEYRKTSRANVTQTSGEQSRADHSPRSFVHSSGFGAPSSPNNESLLSAAVLSGSLSQSQPAAPFSLLSEQMLPSQQSGAVNMYAMSDVVHSGNATHTRTASTASLIKKRKASTSDTSSRQRHS